MQRALMPAAVLFALVITVALTGSTALGIGAAYMQLATSPTLLPDGNWEYVYDVYGNDTPYIVKCGLSGFDASLISNQWTYTYGITGTLVQHWDWEAANDPVSWNREAYGSYSTDGVNWTLHTQPWAYDNTWHTPIEYVPSGTMPSMEGWLCPGQIAEDGQSILFRNYRTGIAAMGLVHTFRIVHPFAPGEIDWWVFSYHPEGQGSGTVLGPVVPEPATLFVMGCGAIRLLRRRPRA